MDPSLNQAAGQGQSSMYVTPVFSSFCLYPCGCPGRFASVSLPKQRRPKTDQRMRDAQCRSPTTPSNAYKVNVNRTKTRKWVEAKTHNYDGDDWGAPEDESDEESDDPDQPPQPSGAGPRPDTHVVPLETRTAAVHDTTAAASSVPLIQQPVARTVEPTVQPPPPQASAQDVATDSDDADDKRDTSPQLPNMARMSAFGVDLFPHSTSQPQENLNAAKHTIQEEREPEPASIASAGEASRAAQSGSPAPQLGPSIPPHTSSIEQDTSTTSEQENVASKDIPASSASASALERTSTNEPQQGLYIGTEPQSSIGAATGPPDLKLDTATSPSDTSTSVVPTEPLQTRRSEQSPADYEPVALRHTSTLDTTSSTPVKDSDVLSEEIMRSLTPGSNVAPASKPNESQTSLAPSVEKNLEDSPSSAGEHKEATAVPIMSIPVQQTHVPTLDSQQSSFASPSEETPHDLRRRFSWEAFGDDEPPKPTAPVPATIPSPVATPAPIAPVSDLPVQSPRDEPRVDERSPISPSVGSSSHPISPTIKIVPDSESIDQHVSEPRPSQQASVGLSRSDTASASSEPSQLPYSQPSGGSEGPADVRQSLVSGNDNSTPPGSSQGTKKPPMPFKDIMNLPTSAERLEKYAESRSSFATSHSELDDWTASMRQHPEHTNVSGSFSGAPPAVGPGGSIARTPSPSGSQPSTQQPYYQQYLNASAPADRSGPSSTRSRLAGFQEHAQAAAGSAFGSSGNQIGHKSKDILQSAGKMGKGLFSKGKSKLRGTGDKVFH